MPVIDYSCIMLKEQVFGSKLSKIGSRPQCPDLSLDFRIFSMPLLLLRSFGMWMLKSSCPSTCSDRWGVFMATIGPCLMSRSVDGKRWLAKTLLFLSDGQYAKLEIASNSPGTVEYQTPFQSIFLKHTLVHKLLQNLRTLGTELCGTGQTYSSHQGFSQSIIITCIQFGISDNIDLNAPVHRTIIFRLGQHNHGYLNSSIGTFEERHCFFSLCEY